MGRDPENFSPDRGEPDRALQVLGPHEGPRCQALRLYRLGASPQVLIRLLIIFPVSQYPHSLFSEIGANGEAEVPIARGVLRICLVCIWAVSFSFPSSCSAEVPPLFPPISL